MGLVGLAHLEVPVRILSSLPGNFAFKHSTLNDGSTVQVTSEKARTVSGSTRQADLNTAPFVGTHGPPQSRISKVADACRYYFSKGGCNRGTSCSFAHTFEGPLTTSVLDAVPDSLGKEMLGARLGPAIRRYRDKLPESILYSMLQRMRNSELLYLVESETALRQKVDEVYSELTSKAWYCVEQQQQESIPEPWQEAVHSEIRSVETSGSSSVSVSVIPEPPEDEAHDAATTDAHEYVKGDAVMADWYGSWEPGWIHDESPDGSFTVRWETQEITHDMAAESLRPRSMSNALVGLHSDCAISF